MEPYVKQLKPGAEKDMIKACSKLAYIKIRRHMKKTTKRKHETSSPSSSSPSSSSSTQCSSDEDMFEDKKKRKKKSPTSILPTPMSESRDPLSLSDNSPSDTD